MKILIKQMAEKENVTEELKVTNQLEWVMNLNENEWKMLQKLVLFYLQMSDYEDRKFFNSFFIF